MSTPKDISIDEAIKRLEKLRGSTYVDPQEQAARAGGVLAEIEQNLKQVQGIVQTVDAAVFSATNAALVFVNTYGKLFGNFSSQIINYNEEIRRSVMGNQELIKGSFKARDEIVALGKETSRFGISTNENLRVAREFARENVKLLPIYRENRKELIDYTARMSAFGVQSQESVKIVDKLTTVLDLNGNQLDISRRNLVTFAQKTGQELSEVVKNYSRSINSFMDFLDPAEMDKNFMKFQVMARRMGTEADTLYQMALKFDTMEGAQQMGARLNQTFSALGIEFNSLAIQDMEPQERIQYMADKTREALTRARQMGGKEGRLIMASLREAGLGSNEMIRALEAEGGSRRASDFEMGAPMGMMTREQEAAQARRYNFTRISTAEAEERAIRNRLESQFYSEFKKVADDFGGYIERAEYNTSLTKDIIAKAAAETADKLTGPAAQSTVGLLTGEGTISDKGREVLTAAGLQNVETFNDLFKEFNNLDPKKMQEFFKSGGFVDQIAKALKDVVLEAIKKSKELP